MPESSKKTAVPAPSPRDPGQRKQAIWDSLPPEIQADPNVRAKFGLGDAVEVMAKPVARLLGIEDCAPCQRRKAALNAASSRAGARIRRMFRSKP